MRVRLVEADMREFHLEERFRLAILALDTFMHLVKTEDQLRALACIASHLVEEGILLLDLSDPLWAGLDRGDGELVLDWMKRDAATGRRVAKLVSRKVEPSTQTQHLVLFYDATDERGSLQRSVVSLRMHYFHRPEVEQLLERSGFRVEQVYGSYELEDYAAESPRMIFVARRRP